MNERAAIGPIAAIILAVFIVLAAAMALAPKIALHSDGSGQVEKVSLTRKYAAVTLGPKLKANAPNANTSATANTPGASDGLLIARTGSITLFVSNVNSTVTLLSRLAQHERGDVSSMTFDNGGDVASRSSADVSLRVPATHFDDAMAQAARFGTVRQSSVSAEDLTSDITDSTARLRNLRRTETDILRIMERSGSVGEVLNAENQLSQVRENIETLESDLKFKQNRVIYATVDISVASEANATVVEPGFAAQLSNAWLAALDSLSQTTLDLLALITWLVVYLPYLAVMVIAGFFLYRRWKARVRLAVGAQQP